MKETHPYAIMHELIAYTRERALAYKTFTGAFIVKDGEVIWRDITSIETDNNPLAHAELKALQGALEAQEGSLAGCQLYTTQQPCPMCASAIAWSGIEAVYYGVPSSHHWQGFGDIHHFLGNLDISCTGSLLEQECRAIDELLLEHGL